MIRDCNSNGAFNKDLGVKDRTYLLGIRERFVRVPKGERLEGKGTKDSERVRHF